MIRPFIFVLALGLIAHAEIEGLPKPGEPRAMTFAQPQEKTLANGLRVIVVERPAQPMLEAGLIFKSGAESDPADRAGLTEFTAGALTRGTEKRSATQIAQDLEGLGAAIKTEASWDGTMAMLATLSANAAPALEILADLARHPVFAAAEIDRLKKERIDEREVELEQPSQLARAAATRAILGATPYGHASNGTPASLKRITRADVTAHYARVVRPENTVLVLAGDIKADDAFTLGEKLFGDWKSAPVKKPQGRTKAELPKPSVILIDMADAGQAAVYIGRAEPSRAGDDYFISQIANNVLGGGYSARLNREVRIKRGLSYGCGSKLARWRESGLFGSACQTKNESAAEVVTVIRNELKQIGAEQAATDEINARRLVLTGGFQRELETNEGYVKRIADFVLHGEAPGAFAETLAKYDRVTGDDIKTFAAAQFAPEAMTVIVVGRAKDCEKPLREIFPKLQVVPQEKVNLDSATLR
jgi:zinc protease